MTRKRDRKRSRRRNPEETRAARMWLLGIAGVVVGGTAGYLVASSRSARQIAAQTGLDKWRLPDPSYKPRVPDTAEDFSLLDDIVCECAGPVIDAVVDAAAGDATMETIVDAVRLCVAKELHPDFAWPPVFGDHPSATQLWGELAVLIRRAVLEGRCDRVIPTPVPIPLPLGGGG